MVEMLSLAFIEQATAEDKLLLERVAASIKRVTEGNGKMRIPADMTDPDIVMTDLRNAFISVSMDRNRLKNAREYVERLEMAILQEWRIRTVQAGVLEIRCHHCSGRRIEQRYGEEKPFIHAEGCLVTEVKKRRGLE